MATINKDATDSSIQFTKNIQQNALAKQVEKYYELKANYAAEAEKLKNKISGTDKSNKEKKRDYAESTLKCINCNRKVGMIFKEEGNTFVAQCGAVTGNYKTANGEPIKECDLNLIITIPDYYDIDDIINEYSNVLSKLKKDLKILKLKHLYEHIDDDESLNEYNELIKEYESYSEVFLSLKTKKIEQQTDEMAEMALLKNKHTQLMNSIIDGFKEAEDNKDISREIKKRTFELYAPLLRVNDEIREKEQFKTFFQKNEDDFGSSTFKMRNTVVENEVII